MWRQTTSTLLILLAAAATARAEDAAPAADTLEARPADTAAPANERVAELIRQLDSPRFAERQAASAELAGLGGAAVPALEQAVQGGSREASTRALDLLERFAEEGGMETQAAATAALARIAAGDDAIAAAEAREALGESSGEQQGSTPRGNAIAGLPAQAVPQLVPGVPAMRINPAQAIPARGVRVQRIMAAGGNGTRDITITENGRTVKIHEDANGIQVDITQPDEQGNDKTESYQAGSLDELKRQHPEAAKIYEQFGNGGVQIMIGPAQAPAAPAVPQGAVPGAVPGVPQAGPNGIQLPMAPGDAEAMKREAEALQQAMRLFEQFQQQPEGFELDRVDPASPEADDAGRDE